MRPALRRNFKSIALRVIAEGGGSVEIDRIRQAIQARHPETSWDRRYPLAVLENNGIVETTKTTARFSEHLTLEQIASLLAARCSLHSTNVQFVLSVSGSRTRLGGLTSPSGDYCATRW